MYIDRHIDRQTDRQIDILIDRWIDRYRVLRAGLLVDLRAALYI
jgi:hypothetical protein